MSGAAMTHSFDQQAHSEPAANLAPHQQRLPSGVREDFAAHLGADFDGVGLAPTANQVVTSAGVPVHDGITSSQPARAEDTLQRILGNPAVTRLFGVSADHGQLRGLASGFLPSGGQPLGPSTRAAMETRFGHDFSAVRVHTGAEATESAEAFGASAYSVGHDIVFGDGHAPGTPDGERTLVHELTHVVQQRTAGGGPPGPAHEREAHALAHRSPGAPLTVTMACQAGIPQFEDKAPSALPKLNLPDDWQKKIKEFKLAKGQKEDPGVQAANVEHDHTLALDYVNDFYLNTMKCLDFAKQAESTAIGEFTNTMSVPDAPNVTKEVVMSLLGVGFSAVGGWSVIERGMSKGLFAMKVWNMERQVGEKIGTPAFEALKKVAEPGERNEELGKFLSERAKEGVEAVKTGAEVGEKREAGTSAGETAETANKAAEKSLVDWGTHTAVAIQEKQMAKDHLAQLYKDHAYVWDSLESRVKDTLGQVPDAAAMGKHVLETAHKIELELYKERFSGERAPEIRVIQGGAGVYSRTLAGVPHAVVARIAELQGTWANDLAVGEWLGAKVITSTVHESGKFL